MNKPASLSEEGEGFHWTEQWLNTNGRIITFVSVVQSAWLKANNKEPNSLFERKKEQKELFDFQLPNEQIWGNFSIGQ